MSEINLGKNVFDVYLNFLSLAHVTFANMERMGLMTYTAMHHQVCDQDVLVSCLGNCHRTDTPFLLLYL